MEACILESYLKTVATRIALSLFKYTELPVQYFL